MATAGSSSLPVGLLSFPPAPPDPAQRGLSPPRGLQLPALQSTLRPQAAGFCLAGHLLRFAISTWMSKHLTGTPAPGPLGQARDGRAESTWGSHYCLSNPRLPDVRGILACFPDDDFHIKTNKQQQQQTLSRPAFESENSRDLAFTASV